MTAPDTRPGADHPDDEFGDDEDPGQDCGRWSNGKLKRYCALAGTEFCDFECPYRTIEAVQC